MRSRAFVLSYFCSVLLLPQANVLAGGFAYDTDFVVQATGDGATNNVDRKFATKVVEHAAKYRREVAQKWLGEELPPSVGRTQLTVLVSHQEDSGKTWPMNKKVSEFHNVHVTSSKEALFGGTLAHEVAHVVLATQYPHPRLLAPWVTEGIATQYDQPKRKEVRQKILKWYAKTGNWPALRSVLEKKSFLATDKSDYAVAESVTNHLLKKGTPTKFVKFAEQAQGLGWDEALRTAYQIDGVEALEQEWRKAIQQDQKQSLASATTKPR